LIFITGSPLRRRKRRRRRRRRRRNQEFSKILHTPG
jgi:hypothetical protein